MIISPKVIVDKEILKSTVLPFESNQIQQNGIDLRLDEVSSLSGLYIFGEDLKDSKISEFRIEKLKANKNGFFYFKKGCAYSLLFFETSIIPENTTAMVYGRSSLNRRGILIRGSVYDSGFCGRVGATLYAGIDCAIRREQRIAQIIFFESDSASIYNGQYQSLVAGMGVVEKKT